MKVLSLLDMVVVRSDKMKLEVGMYCYNITNRKLGIGKIINFQSNNNVNIKYKNEIYLVSIGNIKASFNVIDILEEGDYVNGNIVLFKDTGIAHDQNLIVCVGRDEERHIYDEICIKSVITHEQMEQISYKLGE